MAKTFLIHSSHGDFTTDDKGVPFGVVPDAFHNVVEVDVDEYLKWAEQVFPQDLKNDVIEVDVLEVGYWYARWGKRKYEPADADFRKDVVEAQLTGA